MKIIKNKNVILAVLAVMIVFVIGAFQSCSDEMDATQGFEKQKNAIEVISEIELNSKESDEIINSNEFEEYIKATAKLAIEYIRLDSILKNDDFLKKAKQDVATTKALFIPIPFKMDKDICNQT